MINYYLLHNEYTLIRLNVCVFLYEALLYASYVSGFVDIEG